MNKLSVAAMFVLWGGGCGVTDTHLGGEGVARQMEQDYGGPSGLMDFFASHTEEEIRDALKPYGVGYVVHGNATQAAIGDCPKYFPAGDRSIWHNFDGEYYFIDSAGRPNRAYKDLPPIVAAPRVSTCQTNVGQWGDAENPSNDYDGGHLIGSQLGGWGGRANLVPQDANFNRGNWVALENAMADCGSLPNGRMRYTLGANYPNSTTLIPNTMTMEIQNQSSGASVSLSFTNTDGGGSNGASERARGVNWLASQGCI
ncbi:DNA/RNA non-specific endonuclease [Myxococcus stipitatus]|uniref:DNA/RNA non-specific endonuclease n=1 Tax=Myxococcus stipitatus TaxID=83455 RepID=UPI003144F818